ncbi:HTH_48 domain-containing protein [Trichonephila inaurata madagascariensis]|uniref:HTH_48 domain-containing protein n=1 Tax=Trichonephila inaurata madagascariensis TaxID=2747483 RepID=A0A8X6Y2P6_9ARAC|nr:HTH_48 domain-containing protein [Trichonephila inaurata madagascariensis]
MKNEFKVTPTASEVMATIFKDSCGVIMIDYRERVCVARTLMQIVIVPLTRLRKAIQHKRPVILSEGIILLHDNSRPHTSQVKQKLLQRFRREIWSHSPYNPDLASNDYFLFRG